MEKQKSIKNPENSIQSTSSSSTCNPLITPLMPSIHVSEPPFGLKDFNLISAVEALRRLNPQEISKLLKENENLLLLHILENGSTLQVDMEKLARFLPLHLTAMLLSSKKDEAMLRYLLSGLRLLYTLCEIATRHPKLEQIFLDDVRVSVQLLDMVFYVLILCSACKQLSYEGNRNKLRSYEKAAYDPPYAAFSWESHLSGAMPILYAAIVPCSVYLLTACISSQWNDLAFVLHAHPKVDIFIDVAFGAVRRNINFIQTSFSATDYTLYSNSSLAVEREVCFYCQQCEASLQFLQQICQNKCFHERLLMNKELCGRGGVLRLVQAALNLNTPLFLKESYAVIASVSRLKARVLSILLYLCEAESVSYLDDVASIPKSLELAKSVALEVIELLKTMLSCDLKQPVNYSVKTYPMGLLQLNALRLADIFSDDSNLRSYVTIYFAEVLALVLSISYQQFLSNWCSSDLPMKEEDILLDYEPFTVAGWVLDLSSSSDICNVEICESNFIRIGNAQASYAHQRTSLLVKVIANLHCFVPNICEEQERNLFLQKFIDHLKIDCQDPQVGDSFPSQQGPVFSFNSAPQNAATVCKNLRSLLGHAESLIPTSLNEEDVQLLRVFFTQVQSIIGPTDSEVNRRPVNTNSHNEMQIVRDCSSPLHGGIELELRSRNSVLRESMSENSAFAGACDPCSNDEHIGEVDGVLQDDNICEGKSSEAVLKRLPEVEKEVQTSANINDGHCQEVDAVMQNVSKCEGRSSQALTNAETSGSDLSSSRGKNPSSQIGNGEITKSSEHSKNNIKDSVADEKIESRNSEEKQKKRKRPIFNDTQASLFVKAVEEEPNMHRKASLLLSWAAKLSCHGPEVTSQQLKNWVNNRKAKLARKEAKNGPITSDNRRTTSHQNGSSTCASSNPQFTGSNSGHKTDHNQTPAVETALLGANTNQSIKIVRPDSSTQSNPQKFEVSNLNCLKLSAGQKVILTGTQGKEKQIATVERSQRTIMAENTRQTSETENCQVSNSNCAKSAPSQEIVSQDTVIASSENCQVSNSNSAKLVAGQAVILTDSQGKEIAKGTIFQVEGEWEGCNLAESSTCVVDISDLKSNRIVRHPHPSPAGGPTFEEAEVSVGNMRVLWDFSQIRVR